MLIRFIAGSTSQSPIANETCESDNLQPHPAFTFDYLTDFQVIPLFREKNVRKIGIAFQVFSIGSTYCAQGVN